MAIKILEIADRADYEAVYRFLYERWGGKNAPDLPSVDHRKKWVRDDLDDWSRQIVATTEGGRIVGCIRLNLMSGGRPQPELDEQVQLMKMMETFGADQVSFMSNLAVAPGKQSSTVASLLVAALMRIHQKEKIALNTCICPLNLVHFYYGIGYRPYTSNFRDEGSEGGVRVPLIMCIRDMDYLEETESPLLSILPAASSDYGWTSNQVSKLFPDFHKPGFDKYSSMAVWARLAYSTPRNADRISNSLFADLSNEELSAAMAHVTKVEFGAGELIYRKGEKEEGMALLIRGSLGVSLDENIEDPNFIAVIRSGETFGEMQAFGGGARSANVIALEKSEVMLLPTDLLNRIAETQPKVALHLGINLLKTFTRRLDNANQEIAKLSGPGTESTRVHGVEPELGKQEEIDRRVKSYGFQIIADSIVPLENLQRQAKITEKVEIELLHRAGLMDGYEILDFGSEFGVTSMVLNHHFPQSKITGVESEARPLAKSLDLVQKRAITNIDFIHGSKWRSSMQDGAIDFAYARMIFNSISRHERALQELRRVVRPGGCVSVLDIDDTTFSIHPPVVGLDKLNDRVDYALAVNGGDRRIGSKLYSLFCEADFDRVRVWPVTFSTQDLTAEEFCELALTYKRKILQRAKDLDEEAKDILNDIEYSLKTYKSFACVTLFFASGIVSQSIEEQMRTAL